MTEAPRIEVVLHREFSEPVECPRYRGIPMFVTSCKIVWQSNAPYTGSRFTVTVFGARRKKDRELYKESLDRTFWSREALPWLERAGVSEVTIADTLVDEARRVAERSHP